MVMYCLAVRIAHRVGYSFRDALALAFAFCFASNVLPVIFAGGDCPLAHVMTLLLSLWALDESMRRNRQWLIGICLAGVFAIRPTAGLIAAFFILDVIFGSIIPLQKKVSRCALLILPICVAGILLAFYNQLRFDDFFDTGYKTAFIGPPFYGLVRERYGLFSLRSILTNFYWYFLAGPRPVTEPGTYHLVFPYVFPNSIGMSFFILSPIFLRLFWARIIGKRQIFLWITSLVILVVLLTYYSTGFVQIGPRYMLDLLPLWYILLLYSFDGMRLRMRHYVFILASFAGDLFLTIFQ